MHIPMSVKMAFRKYLKFSFHNWQMMSDSMSYKRIVSQDHELPTFFNGIPSKHMINVKV